MYDVQTYLKMVNVKNHIKIMDALYDLSGTDKLFMHRGSTPESHRRLERDIGEYPSGRLRLLYNAYCSELREARSALRNPVNQRPSLLKDIINEGLVRSRTAVSFVFRGHQFNTMTHDKPAFEHKQYIYTDHKLGIPKSWLRTVHERGITAVQGSDGDRFIMSAKPRKSPQLDNELYEVVALKKNSAKEAAEHGLFCLENGWVAKAEGISAYAADFKKAQSLLNRRVRAKIMKEFTG